MYFRIQFKNVEIKSVLEWFILAELLLTKKLVVYSNTYVTVKKIEINIKQLSKR